MFSRAHQNSPAVTRAGETGSFILSDDLKELKNPDVSRPVRRRSVGSFAVGKTHLNFQTPIFPGGELCVTFDASGAAISACSCGLITGGFAETRRMMAVSP